MVVSTEQADDIAIQVVFVKWGDRYGPDTVNRHVRAIRRHASCPVHFVMITEDAGGGYDEAVRCVPFPPFTAPFDYLKHGCRLKLAVFAPGMLDPDLPAFFMDLDTMIRGDVARIRDDILAKGQVALLQNHYVPWWPLQKYLRPLLGEIYYFCNSSAIGFMPRDHYWIYDELNARIDGSVPNNELPKKYRSDERFISYIARDRLRVFSTRLIVKFAEEYLTPWLFVEAIRKRLPWVWRRREQLVAITFVSESLKPDKLVRMKPGDRVVYKHFLGVWDYPEYSRYWAEPVD